MTKAKKKDSSGRPAREPQNDRGRKIVKHLEARGFTITKAADTVGLSFESLFKLVHQEPPPRVTGETIAKLTAKPLELPLELVCPALSRAG